MMAVLLGLLGGVTLGICVSPLWMMLQLPMRAVDVCDAGGMRMCAWALAIGAMLGSLNVSGFLPQAAGISAMFFGGLFVGMLASALEEAVEVIPALFDRLSITADMRFAAAAIAIGKAAGAVAAGLMGV